MITCSVCRDLKQEILLKSHLSTTQIMCGNCNTIYFEVPKFIADFFLESSKPIQIESTKAKQKKG